MANIVMRFPGGLERALTLSYDDGVEQDIRLLEIMKRNGLRGTFNLSSGLYPPEGHVWPEGTIHRRMTKSAALALFRDSGMEVAVHSSSHVALEQLPPPLCIREILLDRENLERDFGGMVRGMAYPYGTYNDDVVEAARLCGIAYARTTLSTLKFTVPQDWLRMPATCHHNNPELMNLARRFLEGAGTDLPKLFYLWGHSYEFERDNNWHVIEEFAEFMGGRDNIWYATNMEVCDYVRAYRQLIFSADGRTVYNPTVTTLYFQISGKDSYTLEPGCRCTLPEILG